MIEVHILLLHPPSVRVNILHIAGLAARLDCMAFYG